MAELQPGDAFPEMTVSTADGGTLWLPGDLTGDYAVVLFYRAHW